MKKSMKRNMLMSTIAMIVVVVMAISTATFAWFSAFQTVDATLNFAVEAGDAGFQMRSRVVVQDATSTTLGDAWSDWTNTVAMTEPDADGSGSNAVKYTLSAPQTDITAPVYAGGADVTTALPTNDKTLFYTAMEPSNGKLYVANVEGAKQVHYAAYTEIQVQSASATAQNMLCTATVKTAAGQETDAKSVAALAKTKIVIVAIKGDGATGSPVYMGEQFNYGFYDTTTFGGTTVNFKGSATQVKEANKDFFDEVTNKLGTGSENTFLKAQCSGRTTAIAISGTEFTAPVTSGVKTFTHTFNALTTAKEDYITLRIYSWIDGHTGDTQLKGGQVAVSVVFSKAAAGI